MHYLDPKNDVVFKKIFGKHKHLLIAFLNDLLMLSEDQSIMSLEYLSGEQVPDVLQLKNSIVDVKCRVQNGSTFVVEMQMHWSQYFKRRVLFNASNAYVSQLNTSQDYSNLHPVYSLNIVYRSFHADPDKYYHRYRIVEDVNTHERIDGLQFVFIELCKFLSHQTKGHHRRMSRWVKLLMVADNPEVIDELKQDPLTSEAYQLTLESYYSPTEKEAYDKYCDIIRTELTKETEQQQAMIQAEQRGIEKGIQEGLQKGIQDGIEQGLQQGRQEGLIEGIKQVVMTMYQNGVPLSVISANTGISESELMRQQLIP